MNRELRLEVDVISSDEEARLAFLSVARAFDVSGREVAVTVAIRKRVGIAEQRGGFVIMQKKAAAGIYVDANDHAGVVRAAGDLQADVARVTGCTSMPVLARTASFPWAQSGWMAASPGLSP